MTKKPSDLRPGDRIDLGRGPVLIQSVTPYRTVLDDRLMWIVRREPDGGVEATFYESDQVAVVSAEHAWRGSGAPSPKEETCSSLP